MVAPLVANMTYSIAWWSGDGAYDQVKVCDELEMRGIEPVIPPRSNAVIWTNEAGGDLLHARNEAITQIECLGLAEWNRIAEATPGRLTPPQQGGNGHFPLEDGLRPTVVKPLAGKSASRSTREGKLPKPTHKFRHAQGSQMGAYLAMQQSLSMMDYYEQPERIAGSGVDLIIYDVWI